MDSPCIKQTVCKVLNRFHHGKYLVSVGHSPPLPPGHVPPYEKWHMRTSAPQAIDIGGHVPPN